MLLYFDPIFSLAKCILAKGKRKTSLLVLFSFRMLLKLLEASFNLVSLECF